MILHFYMRAHMSLFTDIVSSIFPSIESLSDTIKQAYCKLAPEGQTCTELSARSQAPQDTFEELKSIEHPNLEVPEPKVGCYIQFHQVGCYEQLLERHQIHGEMLIRRDLPKLDVNLLNSEINKIIDEELAKHSSKASNVPPPGCTRGSVAP